MVPEGVMIKKKIFLSLNFLESLKLFVKIVLFIIIFALDVLVSEKPKTKLSQQSILNTVILW